MGDTLTFDAISKGLHGVTAVTCQSYIGSARACLHKVGHKSPTLVTVTGIMETTVKLEWEPVTPQLLNENDDYQDAAEFGAYAVAFAMANKLTKYTVVRRARKNGGFDWFLGYESKAFQDAARLEISGLLDATEGRYNARVKEKLAQSDPSDKTRLPAYASVTNFRGPKTCFQKKS